MKNEHQPTSKSKTDSTKPTGARKTSCVQQLQHKRLTKMQQLYQLTEIHQNLVDAIFLYAIQKAADNDQESIFSETQLMLSAVNCFAPFALQNEE